MSYLKAIAKTKKEKEENNKEKNKVDWNKTAMDYETVDQFLYKDIQMRLKDVQFANDASMEDDRDEYEDEGMEEYSEEQHEMAEELISAVKGGDSEAVLDAIHGIYNSY